MRCWSLIEDWGEPKRRLPDKFDIDSQVDLPGVRAVDAEGARRGKREGLASASDQSMIT